MYKRTSESITKKNNMPRMKFKFIYLKFILEFTKNTKYEKDMVNLYLSTMSKKHIKEQLSKIEFYNDFDFYYKVINEVINCIYISDDNFNFLNILKNIILKKKQNLY